MNQLVVWSFGQTVYPGLQASCTTPLPCDVCVISLTSRSTCTDNIWCKVETKLNVAQSNVQVPLVNSTIILDIKNVTFASHWRLQRTAAHANWFLFNIVISLYVWQFYYTNSSSFFLIAFAVLRSQRNTFCTPAIQSHRVYRHAYTRKHCER